MEHLSSLTPYNFPVIGGALIGLAVTLMLLMNGRVTGISGIMGAVVAHPFRGEAWRWAFILGLVVGGTVMGLLYPDLFVNDTSRGSLVIAVAGFLVGFGTLLGSGCTSGHGICGMSRFSIRSLVATLVFMFFGFISVQLISHSGLL